MLTRLLLVATLPSLLSGQGPTMPGAADSIIGMWGVEQLLGPDLRGTLLIRRDRRGWHGRIGDEQAHAPPQDSIRLHFGTRGEFRGTDSERGVHGFWIQPEGHGMRASYATPAELQLVRGGWQWVIRPLDDRISLYLSIRRDSTGSLNALLTNPEGNFGDAAFDVLIDAATDSVRLRNRSDSTQTLHGVWKRDTLRLTLPDFGSFGLTRRDRATAPGFFASRGGAASYQYSTPRAEKGDLPVASLTSVNLDSVRVLKLVRSIQDLDARQGGMPLVHSLLIARHGKLVVEEYFHGFDASMVHDLRSASKTFVSVLAGIVSLDPKTEVYKNFARYQPFANWVPGKASMTFAHLLTMTSGLACDDNDNDSPGNEGTMQSQTRQRDWYKYTLDLPLTHAPGDTAAYCSAGINLAGGVLANRTRQWLPALIDERLMRPLGITEYHVNLMPAGQAYMGGGVYMRPRDLLKIGQLYLDGGRWRGQQIVPSSWVKESTRLHPEINAKNTDAYMWHTNTIRVGDREYREIEANGNGGQLLMLIPELDLVVVTTAGNYNRYGVWRRFRDEWLANYIIP